MSDSQSFGPPPVPPQGPSLPPPVTARTGPPWEQPGPPVERFVNTAKGVLLDPQALFSTMRREGGLQKPLVYAVIGATAGAVVSAAYRLLLSGAVSGLAGPMSRWGSHFGPVSFVSTVIGAPVVAALVTFILAGIYHVLLMLLDGARFPFETTFRVSAYTIGSTALLAVIPFCGNFIGGIWGLVSAIYGLARAHEIPTGKAAVAVLVPTLVCCFLAFLVLTILGLSALALLGAARG
jgi:hypothetical protein